METDVSTSSLFRHYHLLSTWKRFILVNTVILTMISVGISFLLPQWYKSTASVLPPKEQDFLSGLGGAGSLLKGLSGGKSLGGLGNNQGSYNYFAILKSRTASEKVIKKFNLIEEYDISDNDMDKAIKELSNNTRFETQEDDNITIEVFDKSPNRAAEMANYYVTILNEMSVELGTLEAKNNRIFIEKRLEKCYKDLRNAEEKLKSFQEQSGLIIIQDDKNSSVSAYAELFGLKAKKEIELAVLEKSVTGDNAILKQTKVEVAEITKKLDSFPSSGLESVRLYRDVVTQQKILEFVLPLYEQAKVEEQKDIPVLLVLDHAVPPHRKDKPKRLIIVGFTTFFALTGSILMVYLFQLISTAALSSKADVPVRWVQFLSAVKRWYKIPSPVSH